MYNGTTTMSTASGSPDSGYLETMDSLNISGYSGGASSSRDSSFSDSAVLDEVDVISVKVKAGNSTTEMLRVNGDSQETASSSAPVGYPSHLGGSCGSLGSITVQTYINNDPPVVPSMQVFVKTIRGNTVTCDLTIESLVRDLATEAFRKSGVPAEQQRLVFQGRPLSCDTDPLISYEIKNGSTVHMMGRLRGGVTINRISPIKAVSDKNEAEYYYYYYCDYQKDARDCYTKMMRNDDVPAKTKRVNKYNNIQASAIILGLIFIGMLFVATGPHCLE